MNGKVQIAPGDNNPVKTDFSHIKYNIIPDGKIY
jgi:hypothetical protein